MSDGEWNAFLAVAAMLRARATASETKYNESIDGLIAEPELQPMTRKQSHDMPPNTQEQCSNVEKLPETVKNLVLTRDNTITTQINNFGENKQHKVRKPAPFNLSKTSELFSGRDTELSGVHTGLREHKALALCGAPGVGKSELARAYAWEHSEQYASNLIWINAESEERIKTSFHELAIELSIPVQENNITRNVPALLQDIYTNFNKSNVLFIFDNVTSFTNSQKYLPSSIVREENNIHVMLTSQSIKWNDDIEVINIEPLEESTTMEIFHAISEKLNIPPEENACKELSRYLNNFPTAIQVTAQAVHENLKEKKNFTFTNFLTNAVKKPDIVLEKPISSYNNSTIYGSFERTLEEIEVANKNDMFCTELLMLCSFMDCKYLYVTCLYKLLGGKDTKEMIDKALRVLSNNSLIRVDGDAVHIYEFVQLSLRYLQYKRGITSHYKSLLKLMLSDDKTLIRHRKSILKYAAENANTILEIFKEQHSIIHLLEEYECVGILNEILKDSGQMLMYEAARSGDLRTVKLVVKYSTDAKILNKYKDICTPLKAAITGKHQELCEFLLSAPIYIHNKEIFTELHESVKLGDRTVTQFLIENKLCEVNAQDDYGCAPLHYAAERDNEAIMTLLMDAGAEIDVKTIKGWTPLHYAAEQGNVAIATLLMNAGAEIDAKDEIGVTPLHYAAERGNEAIVTLLLNAGAEIDVKTLKGWTPLHCAAERGNVAIATLLMDAGAETDVKAKNGRTPLHIACIRDLQATAKLLIGRGRANVDMQDNSGWTPLHHAAQLGNLSVLTTLIEAGASEFIPNETGQYAIQLATSRGFGNAYTYVVQRIRRIKGIQVED